MKRFLQGLGAGILATALVFTVAYYTVGSKKMSDREIINKAQKLGMVQVTEPPLFTDNDNKENETQQNEVQPDNVENPNEQGQNGEQNGDSDGVTQEQEEPSEGDAVDLNNDSNSSVPENDTAENNGIQNSEGNDTEDNNVVKITINSGDDAIIVSRRLEKLGIISDAAEFDKYLRDNSQSHTIQIGTFDLHPGMTYEEVSAVISGRV